jgi:hypothetical protein
MNVEARKLSRQQVVDMAEHLDVLARPAGIEPAFSA